MTQISEDCFFNIEQILSKMNAQKLSLFDATLLRKSGQNFISLNEVAVMMTSLASSPQRCNSDMELNFSASQSVINCQLSKQ